MTFVLYELHSMDPVQTFAGLLIGVFVLIAWRAMASQLKRRL